MATAEELIAQAEPQNRYFDDRETDAVCIYMDQQLHLHECVERETSALRSDLLAEELYRNVLGFFYMHKASLWERLQEPEISDQERAFLTQEHNRLDTAIRGFEKALRLDQSDDFLQAETIRFHQQAIEHMKRQIQRREGKQHAPQTAVPT